MKLIEILSSSLHSIVCGLDTVEIEDITLDSRKVQKGSVFVAQTGLQVDGHVFIRKAIENGATAVIGLRFDDADIVVAKAHLCTLVQSVEYEHYWGYPVAAFYDFPTNKLRVIGVTGTDGKTTTTSMIYFLLKSLGKRVGLLSTISAKIFDGNIEKEIDTGLHVTAPHADDVQRYLSNMVKDGCEYAVVEMTSHGFDQGRAAGTNFDIGIVTNLSHEHLDYHKTLEHYVLSKGRLFGTYTAIPQKDDRLFLALINEDDHAWGLFKPYTEGWKVFGYGVNDFSSFHIVDYRYGTMKMHATMHIESQAGIPVNEYTFELNLPGLYNVYNATAALACVSLLNLNVLDAAKALGDFKNLPGRFEVFTRKDGATIVVDFAHTPRALREVLELGHIVAGDTGRVIVVFGSAGLRDIDKRLLMGQVAGEIADISIVTAEDPRTESLDSISSSIIEGLKESGAESAEIFPYYLRIDDRSEAIKAAIHLARPQDIVLICGKGHEKSMCFGTEEYPWSDQEVVREALGVVQ